MPAKILLSGRPGVGKTTVIRKIASVLAKAAGGFYTNELREKGRRVGFEVNPLGGQARVFAHVNFVTSIRVGRYRVKVDVLEKVAVQAVKKAMAEDKVVIIDEIGKMELHSKPFRQVVREALDSPCPVIATITLKDTPLTRSLRRHPAAHLIEVTCANRDGLPDRIVKMVL